MTTTKRQPQHTPELRERAVRMVLEHRKSYPSLWATIEAMAPKFGCAPRAHADPIRHPRQRPDSLTPPHLSADNLR